jgi:hypothetical protein
MAAVSAVEFGLMKVQPSQGATSGIGIRLEGIFMSPRRTFGITTSGVTVTAPAGGGTVLLPVTTLNLTDIGCFLTATGVQIAVTTSSASGTNVQSAYDSTTGLTSLTFDSSLAGNVYSVYYLYPMSPLVEQGIYGNTSPGFFASDVLMQSSIIKFGRVSTTNFDPAANWYTGTNDPGVKVVAGGIFTDTASSSAGFVATNADIVAFPTPATPWLTLELH